MTRLQRCSALIGGCLCMLVVSAGCGGQRNPPPNPESQAEAKVKAIKRLAEAMAQDPQGAEARGALEDFRNIPLDPGKKPEQAAEIMDVYRQRIQGKFKGFVAQEIEAEMRSLQMAPK